MTGEPISAAAIAAAAAPRAPPQRPPSAIAARTSRIAPDTRTSRATRP